MRLSFPTPQDRDSFVQALIDKRKQIDIDEDTVQVKEPDVTQNH